MFMPEVNVLFRRRLKQRNFFDFDLPVIVCSAEEFAFLEIAQVCQVNVADAAIEAFFVE